jgi:hypothetical protein
MRGSIGNYFCSELSIVSLECLQMALYTTDLYIIFKWLLRPSTLFYWTSTHMTAQNQQIIVESSMNNLSVFKDNVRIKRIILLLRKFFVVLLADLSYCVLFIQWLTYFTCFYHLPYFLWLHGANQSVVVHSL